MPFPLTPFLLCGGWVHSLVCPDCSRVINEQHATLQAFLSALMPQMEKEPVYAYLSCTTIKQSLEMTRHLIGQRCVFAMIL